MPAPSDRQETTLLAEAFAFADRCSRNVLARFKNLWLSGIYALAA